jgi:hypothetical protein
MMMGGKSVAMKTSDDEKIPVTIMLMALAGSRKLPPYMILNLTTVPKEHLPAGIIVRCQTKG